MLDTHSTKGPSLAVDRERADLCKERETGFHPSERTHTFGAQWTAISGLTFWTC